MSEEFPLVYLATQGEIACNLTCRNTMLTRLPLTEAGGRYAFRLQPAHTPMLESTGQVPECSPQETLCRSPWQSGYQERHGWDSGRQPTQIFQNCGEGGKGQVGHKE